MKKHAYAYSILGVTALAAVGGVYFVPKAGTTPFWDANSDTQVSYLYVPGLISTELKMARYCPEFMACTGEKIISTRGGHVIGQPHTCVIFPDVDLRKPTYWTINPITILSNKFRRDLLFPLSKRFFEEHYGVTVIDNPASKLSVVNYTPRCGAASIGQKRDIKALRKYYDKHLAQYPDTDIILYGDSRGAATIFNFIALAKPTRVRAAVLEGIFDTVPHCIKHFLYDDKGPQAEKRLQQILSWTMRKYRKNGITPLHSAQTISDDIPLLLVTSLKDGIVPAQGTIGLYKHLKARGHKNVHLLVLKKSFHTIYMLDDPEDHAVYEMTVHAFYQAYNLPHNAEKAALGQRSFLATQPAVHELAQLYPLARCELCA